MLVSHVMLEADVKFQSGRAPFMQANVSHVKLCPAARATAGGTGEASEIQRTVAIVVEVFATSDGAAAVFTPHAGA